MSHEVTAGKNQFSQFSNLLSHSHSFIYDEVLSQSEMCANTQVVSGILRADQSKEIFSFCFFLSFFFNFDKSLINQRDLKAEQQTIAFIIRQAIKIK